MELTIAKIMSDDKKELDVVTRNEKVVQVTIAATGLQQNDVQRLFICLFLKETLALVKHIRVRTGNWK